MSLPFRSTPRLQPESVLGQEHEFVDRRRPVVLGQRVQYPQFRDEVAKLVKLRVDVGTRLYPSSASSMTGVSHQVGQECDQPVERVILMLGRTGVHSSVLLFKTSTLRRCRVPTPSRSCAHRGVLHASATAEDLAHSVRHADVDRGCPHHDLGENPMMRWRGCECLRDVSVALPPPDVLGVREFQGVRADLISLRSKPKSPSNSKKRPSCL